MNENKLKTYDIASYNIELEYNKEIAPIEKVIQKLTSSHETKSLKAHKDFLAKEKASTKVLSQLQEKSVLKHQRIERAVENKLKKLEPRLRRIETDLEEFIEEQTTLANEAKTSIHAAIEELKLEEQQQIADIQQKYKINIESYLEKLNIYNDNFEKNKQFHHKQVQQYDDQLNDYLANIQAFYDQTVQELETNLRTYLEQKTQSDTDIEASFKDTIRVLNNQTNNIRKQANVDIAATNEYVDTLQDTFEHHYASAIEGLQQHIHQLQQDFAEREALIERDLDINVQKLEAQLADLPEDGDKRIRKSLEQKLELFQLRAATTIRYEQRLLDQQLLLLEQEQKELARQQSFEENNLEKLRVFLVNDESSLKEASELYKDLNIILREQLNTVEHINNDYIFKHEQLKADFITEYTRIFAELKRATVDLARSYLEKIAENNHEIDEINKFIDTAEPLREIEVNRLREDIEISEVKERFNIKFAAQQYEIDKIDSSLAQAIEQEEINAREKQSEYQKDVADIRHKEIFDKAIETAKLKHKKAEQIYKLRTNNINLERKLLNSKFETEVGIFEEHKKQAEIEVRKSHALKSKEIEYNLRDIEIEAKYKVEVIQKRLEEDLMKLEEELNKAKYESDAYQSNLQIAIDKKKTEIKQREYEVTQSFTEKLHLIDKALERELRQPIKNKLKTEAVVDERLSKLDLNNAIFGDYIPHALEAFKDDKLSLEQVHEMIANDETIIDKAIKYLSRTYDVYQEAITFMGDIEERNILHQISATSDQGKIKKLTKQQEKVIQERTKDIDAVHREENDHKSMIRSFVTAEIDALKRLNPNDVNELIEQTDLAYNKVFAKLGSVQETIKESIVSLYFPLSKHDQDLIDYAEKNAETAKQKVQEDMATAIAPLTQELADYIAQTESNQDEFIVELQGQIEGLKARINEFKSDALAQTNAVQEENDRRIKELKDIQAKLEETEQQDIVKAIETIDQQVSQLINQFDEAMTSLTEKDDEAAKIFGFEERIYNIAVESATSRLDDSLMKSKNAHLNNIQLYRADRERAKQAKDAKEHQLNQDLLELTQQFERNIFTVRPRLEESIGDAQKEIDNQIAERMELLRDLETNNERLISSAENRLFTAYQEGTDKLSENLQHYIEKYRMIEEEYNTDNTTANKQIQEHNITYARGLFDLHKAKHQSTLEQLLAINAGMFAKGE